MWLINMRHWLNQQKDGPAAPQVKVKVKKLTEIIVYATACRSGMATGEAPKCWRRPKRKPCKGILQIRIEKNVSIYWRCPECEDKGRINGWKGLIWDIGEGTIH
jgi:hypothetical protein